MQAPPSIVTSRMRGSVVAYTLPHNTASRRVMEKLGFSYEREVVYADLPHVLYRRYSPGSR